eukprot:c9604_g1_i3.p1 GENE.c9604_g1_i3~~c9604_g1_i3.p1  ORF type:complete len:423 (-),score=118.12 c9604_g1_i3:9-1277(-)
MAGVLCEQDVWECLCNESATLARILYKNVNQQRTSIPFQKISEARRWLKTTMQWYESSKTLLEKSCGETRTESIVWLIQQIVIFSTFLTQTDIRMENVFRMFAGQICQTQFLPLSLTLCSLSSRVRVLMLHQNIRLEQHYQLLFNKLTADEISKHRFPVELCEAVPCQSHFRDIIPRSLDSTRKGNDAVAAVITAPSPMQLTSLTAPPLDPKSIESELIPELVSEDDVVAPKSDSKTPPLSKTTLQQPKKVLKVPSAPVKGDLSVLNVAKATKPEKQKKEIQNTQKTAQQTSKPRVQPQQQATPTPPQQGQQAVPTKQRQKGQIQQQKQTQQITSKLPKVEHNKKIVKVDHSLASLGTLNTAHIHTTTTTHTTPTISHSSASLPPFPSFSAPKAKRRLTSGSDIDDIFSSVLATEQPKKKTK